MAELALAKSPDEVERELQEQIVGFYDDPLGYVLFTFPWGEEGTILADEEGPDKWQAEILNVLGEASRTATRAVRIAVASGHGIGKSCLIAWIKLWFVSTRPYQQGVVTANTQAQLQSKTWRELHKWRKLAVNGHWFGQSATKLFYKPHAQTWFTAAIPWSKEKSEAFAGTHEEHVLVLYDEASIIPKEIWEVTEGAMTEAGAFWIVFGNPTDPNGQFASCFHGPERNRWIHKQIDSRDAKRTNKEEIEEWVRIYGEDSDFVKVRVRGLFPSASPAQFIPSDIVDEAYGRSLHPTVYQHAPKILGVDVAREGDDRSVIIRRQGLSATNLQKFQERDLVAFARRIAHEIKVWQPDAIFVDAVGIGAGVVDILRNWGHRVVEVKAGSKPSDTEKYLNLKAEMWDKMRDWLIAGGAIPEDPDLSTDLTAPQFQYSAKDQLDIESKKMMKARGAASPDCADALAHTFAAPVVIARDMRVSGLNKTARTGYEGGDRYADVR